MKTVSKISSALLLLLMLQNLNNLAIAQSAPQAESEKAANRQVVNRFFEAIEAQKFDIIKEVFSENARQLNPYAPEGFPKSFEGSEAIFKQFSALTNYFGQMKFPRQIFATEDPDFFFVKFKGDMEVKGGGKYENDYLGTFRLKDGKIIEYAEYFNPIVMAKAFNIKL